MTFIAVCFELLELIIKIYENYFLKDVFKTFFIRDYVVENDVNEIDLSTTKKYEPFIFVTYFAQKQG